MGLKDTITSLKKQMKEAFEYDDQVEVISTGSLAVDLITGIGGFPRKRVSEVFGWESSGKTTLCLQACAQAQKDGLTVAYLDMERGVDLSFAGRIGFRYDDPDHGVFMSPTTFEQCIRAVHELCESGEVDLVVVDSIPAMVPASEISGEIEEVGAVAHRARLLSVFLPKITKTLVESNVALVLVNQMRHRIATSKYDRGPTEHTAGGAALRFYSSLRVDMELVKKGALTRKIVNPLNGKEEDAPVGNLHRAQSFKNKVGSPYRKAEFFIRYDAVANIWGIDNLQTLIDLAKAKGLILQKGGYFEYTGEKFSAKLLGGDKLYTHFQDPEVYGELRTQLGV